jgi:CRP-like cAMP-binding protein
MTRPPRRQSDQRCLLEQIPLLAGLSAPERGHLSGACRTVALPAHSRLFAQGDPIVEVFALISGTLKRAVPLPTGGEKVVELVHPPHLFGVGELFGATRYSSYAETLSECLIVAIAADEFRAALAAGTELAARTIRSLAERQCAIEFEAASHHALTGTQRVLDYLVAQAGGTLPPAGETTIRLDASKKLIASRIGMAPETLSRTLRQLTESGAIVVDGRKVHIQNAILALKVHGGEPKALQSLRRKKPSGANAAATLPPGSLVNLCGRQRMLSQRLATAWTMSGQSIAPTRARVTLRQSAAQFDRNLARLGRLRLSGPLSTAQENLAALWPIYRTALLAPAPRAPSPERVLELSEQILDAADAMAGEAAAMFGTAEAHRVNLAGRNRMISQRMAKLFLFDNWNIQLAEVAHLIESSRIEFARNLDELRAEPGLDPVLGDQLRAVGALWTEFNDAIDGTTRRRSDAARIRSVLAASDRLLRHVDTTVKLYEYLAG